jgi:sigma-B regulation protein RsbU (phosphoserine phosphatase)
MRQFKDDLLEMVMVKRTNEKPLRDEQIYQLTTLVAGRFSLQEALDKLAEAAVRITGVKACSIRLLDEDAGQLRMRSTFGLSEEYRNKGPVTKDDPVITAAFAGEAVVLDDMRDDDRAKYKEATIKEGLVSQLTVAMRFRDKPIGVLRLYSPVPHNFGEDDIALARAVGSQCAVAITNARLYGEAIEGARMAEQVRLAAAIQRRMIPDKAPHIKNFDIAAKYIPCFEIGGDFYDFFRINDNQLVVVISDVIGKGMPAALMMSLFRGSVRAYTDSECRIGAIDSVIGKLNKMACNECRDGEFISLFYAVIDIKERKLTYCNCGHEPTVLIRDGQFTDLDKGGLVLGVEADAQYAIETVELQKGDYLLFYTDGLIDAANFEGELWGRDRMLQTAKDSCSPTAEHTIKNLLAYRRRFVGLAHQTDDTSIIVIKISE